MSRLKTAKTVLAGALILALAAEPAPAFALRARGGGSPVVAAGLERIFAAGAEEGTPIAAVEAARIVRGWEGLQPAQRQAVLESLAGHGYTLEKHEQHRQIILNPPQQASASFIRFPPVIEAPQGSPNRDEVREQGRRPEALGKLGVILAGAGEGSRLLEMAVQNGLLPPDALQRYTKPTAPVMPVTGKPLLFYVLESLADEAETHHVDLPVRLVLHPEVGTRVENAIRAKGNFGLEHLEIVFQGMNPALDSSGQVVLKPDGTVLFNPDGTGGVVEAALRNGGEEWFRGVLGSDARIALIYPDMRVEPELVELVAGAAAQYPRVGVSYRYPQDRRQDNPDPTSNHSYRLGTFAVLSRQAQGGEEGTIVEYAERKNVAGLVEAILQEEEAGRPPQANSGMSVGPLAGTLQQIRRMPPHHQKDKDAFGIGKVQKMEKFATDLPIDGILSIEELTPIKDPDKLKKVREDAVETERRIGKEMGIGVGDPPDSRLEFHVAMRRPGRLIVGRNVRVEGAVGVYVHPGGVALYTRAQPDKPWEPFDPSAKMELFQTQPGRPVVIPDGTVFSPEGVNTSAGAEEPVFDSATVTELRVAVVEHPILPGMAGKTLRMGDGWLIALPERATAEQISEMLMPVAADLSGKGLSVWEYFSGEKDEPLRMFDRAARGIGGRVTLHDRPVESLPLGLMAQIIAALRGIEPSAVREEDVRLFEEALLFA